MRKIVIPLMLLLAASLALAGVARAATVDLPGLTTVPVPLETELIGGDEEEVEEIEWEEEDEEGEEEDEWEEWEEGEEPPAECLLRSASARVVVPTGEDKLRLTIRYTTFEPTEGTVTYKLRGGKGSLRLPPARQSLAKQGVVRLTEPLTEAEAERARAARDFTVKFRIADAPADCQPLFTRHLTIKRAVKSQLTWRQSDSIFGGES